VVCVGAIPAAPALRSACAAVGEPGGALVFCGLLGLVGEVWVGAIPVVEAEPAEVAAPL
jgi:hypothetical protein